MGKLLEVKGLVTQFKVDKNKIINAVDRSSFTLDEGETLAIVGESGSGKSVTALSVMGLVPNPPGHIEAGEILFQGRDLLKLSKKEMRSIRGNHISMIFQEPMTSLNPVYTIGKQITESIRLHMGLSKKDAEARAVELLRKVQIPDPEKRLKTYPHQLSGGMRQRVMICMALACEPKLLIADEPTTALDVTIQAQILDLFRKIQEDLNTATIFVTHDLGVVARIADRVAVMYAGKIVEIGTAEEIFYDPRHPYTKGLLRSLPALSRGKATLPTLPGMPPTLMDPPAGDAFAYRNDQALAIDYEEAPPMFSITPTHAAATWLLDPRAEKNGEEK